MSTIPCACSVSVTQRGVLLWAAPNVASQHRKAHSTQRGLQARNSSTRLSTMSSTAAAQLASSSSASERRSAMTRPAQLRSSRLGAGSGSSHAQALRREEHWEIKEYGGGRQMSTNSTACFLRLLVHPVSRGHARASERSGFSAPEQFLCARWSTKRLRFLLSAQPACVPAGCCCPGACRDAPHGASLAAG